MVIEPVEGNKRENRQEWTIGTIRITPVVIAVPPRIVRPPVVDPRGGRGIRNRSIGVSAAAVTRRHTQDGDAAAGCRPGDFDAENGGSAERISDQYLIDLHIPLVDQKLDECVENLVQFRLGQDSMIVDRDDCIRLQLHGGDCAVGIRCASGAKNSKAEREQDTGERVRSVHDDLMMVFECWVR